MIYELGERHPEIDPSCFIAPSASVIGSVSMGAASSVWFSAVVRADRERVTIGSGSNIQDGAVLHADPGYPLQIGDRVTVGHQAMLHGCTIGDGALIGIHAVVLNGAVIGKDCLIAANALVRENMQVPDGSVVMGSPGKVVRVLDEEQRKMLGVNAAIYIENGRLYSEQLQARSDD